MTLSTATLRILDELYAAQADYRPGAEIAAGLTDKVAVPAVGPTCVANTDRGLKPALADIAVRRVVQYADFRATETL